MKYIELFAGCGGMSLGLKSAGFELVMANELSPMAAETYAFNLLGEDLHDRAKALLPKVERVIWLSSKHVSSDLKLRLREDPREYPQLGRGFSDIAPGGANIRGNLVVGSVVALNKLLDADPAISRLLAHGFGAGSIDLVSGGPPCQSFSMAGLRRRDSERNTLPWEFARFVQLTRPKLVLLENVTGILRPFTDNRGDKYYAWFELAKAFARVGYVPLCLHVNAKHTGVPQNRPRFILIGVRRDYYQLLMPTFNAAEQVLFSEPLSFFVRVQAGEDVPYGGLAFRDVNAASDFMLFAGTFLRPLVEFKDRFVTVRDAIDDLRRGGSPNAQFPRHLEEIFCNVLPTRTISNHQLRKNGPLVQRRFRLYQVLQQAGNGTHKRILHFLNGTLDQVSDADWARLAKYDYLLEDGTFKMFKRKADFVAYLLRHPTKKQTQKALLADEPAPAALSIPDDACHYHHDHQRTLSVREMARIQSFPDSFEFRSKITTGGDMRAFEVPQYTQVGNAVPPLLARALGITISNLLSRVDAN